MRQQYIYISHNKFQTVSWQNDDIETLQISSETWNSNTDQLWNAFEEFVYDNSSIVATNTSNHLILNIGSDLLLPAILDKRVIETLLSHTTNNNFQHETQWVLTTIPTVSDKLTAIAIPDNLKRFLDRTFYPLTIYSALLVMIGKWKRLILQGKIKMYDDALLFVEGDDAATYYGIFNKDMNLICKGTVDNDLTVPQKQYILSVIINELKANKLINDRLYFFTDKENKVWIENIYARKNHINWIPTLDSRSSLATYINDHQSIVLPVKEAVLIDYL